MDYAVVERERVLTKDQADELVGKKVYDCEPNLDEASIVIDQKTKEPIIGYLPLERKLNKKLRWAVLNIKYGTTTRMGSGLTNKSRTFGMAPRKPAARRDSCRPYSLSVEQPAEHNVITDLSLDLADMMYSVFPEVVEHDRKLLDAVAKDWRMTDDSMWTSGVINKSSELPYHRDGFNFDTWSVMPVIRKGMAGGYLRIPEYGTTISCRDGYVVMFCGKKWVHGVTPMESTSPDGYRYSIVYYALQGMKDCFTAAVETKRAQDKRTEREQNMSAAIKGEGAFQIKAHK